MSRELTILLVDDNPHDRHLVLREIRKAYPHSMIFQALDQAQFDQVLSTNTFDVVVTDHNLHWSDGIHVLRSVKSRSPNCAVIMFTGTGSEEIAVEAMKYGLDDYIVKDVKNLVRLRSAIEAAIEQARIHVRTEEAVCRLELLLSHLEVGVFSCTGDGKIIELNDALLRLLGCPPLEETRDRNLAELFEGSTEIRQLLERVVASRTRQECEFQQPISPDANRYFRVLANLLGDGEHSVRIEGLVEDVTNRKQAEARAKVAAVASAQVAMLSLRERQVLELMVAGEVDKVIARRLDTSEKTVENHRADLMRKLQVTNVPELIRVSMFAGVICEE
jgi:PAS domain S-box-containing protein